MPALVVDASAIAALIFSEPEAEQIVARIESSSLMAPRLLAHELDNVCATKIRSAPNERAELLESRRLIALLTIEVLDVEHSDVIELALATGLTANDAAYLWLAIAHGARLVTLDSRLARAASRFAS